MNYKNVKTVSKDDDDDDYDLNSLFGGLDDTLLIEKPISKGEIYSCHFDTDIDIPQTYRNFHKLCRIATDNDVIKLYINSGGGYVDSMVQVMSSIASTKAKVIAHIYYACSAAAFIGFSCDEIVVEDFATLMIHNLSAGASGKIGEMRSQTEYLDKHSELLLKTIFKNFLTEKELDDVLGGKDIWLVEPEIKERLVGFKTIKELKKVPF